ncbi:MAG: YdbC family protein [Pyramidobacter sp.]|nr:YdbC family protein [Pyramidobacter sp.]
MTDITFEIIEELGVISRSAKGWTKELNRVSWNGAEPKYDIRTWSPGHQNMGKGVTLSEEEMQKLKQIIMLNF